MSVIMKRINMQGAKQPIASVFPHRPGADDTGACF